MANEKQLHLLKQGPEIWNEWRQENPTVRLDLARADLNGAYLGGADLHKADLREANLGRANLFKANLADADLSGATLTQTNLRKANLRWTNLTWANLSGAFLADADLAQAELFGVELVKADLRGTHFTGARLIGRANLSGADLIAADLSGTDLIGVDLSGANLYGANLTGADLRYAQLIETNFEQANLTDCRICGICAEELNLRRAIQSNLLISHPGEPAISVDNLEVAQFIYLLLNHRKVREIIRALTTQVVLILGRFTPDRQAVLDAIRGELGRREFAPVIFDFENSAGRDFTDTLTTLAGLSRFIIADITDPYGIPPELGLIIPQLPSVPVQPLLYSTTRQHGMFDYFKRYPSVLEPYRYANVPELLAVLGKRVIAPIEARAQELARTAITSLPV